MTSESASTAATSPPGRAALSITMRNVSQSFAVDLGALAGPQDGIYRYLASLFSRLLRLDSTPLGWLLYCRRPKIVAVAFGRSTSTCDCAATSHRASADSGSVRRHFDRLPSISGRVLSLASSLPFWLANHQPILFWSPAHRLPLWVPHRTARVVTIHDLCWAVAPETMRPVTRWLDRVLMPRSLTMADRIIAVSEATRSDLVKRFPSIAERIVVVHEAAETLPPPEPIDALRMLGISAPYVLFVGSLEPRKNLARLMTAFAKLPDSVRQTHLLVIAGGRGWGGVDVATMAGRLGISERVRSLGVVDDTRLATLYRHARCLAMTSLYEGFGLPVLEALAQGTPALVAGGSSLPEVAGDAGLVVDPLSVDSICSGLQRMLTDDDLHAKLAAAAAPRAAMFSWERAARETLDVFQQAIEVRQRLLSNR